MADVTLTNNSKTSVTMTPTSKPTIARTWDEATYTWDESIPDTWDTQRGTIMANTAKISITLTSTSKN